jgi:hypothetical protein
LDGDTAGKSKSDNPYSRLAEHLESRIKALDEMSQRWPIYDNRRAFLANLFMIMEKDKEIKSKGDAYYDGFYKKHLKPFRTYVVNYRLTVLRKMNPVAIQLYFRLNACDDGGETMPFQSLDRSWKEDDLACLNVVSPLVEPSDVLDSILRDKDPRFGYGSVMDVWHSIYNAAASRTRPYGNLGQDAVNNKRALPEASDVAIQKKQNQGLGYLPSKLPSNKLYFNLSEAEIPVQNLKPTDRISFRRTPSLITPSVSCPTANSKVYYPSPAPRCLLRPRRERSYRW